MADVLTPTAAKPLELLTGFPSVPPFLPSFPSLHSLLPPFPSFCLFCSAWGASSGSDLTCHESTVIPPLQVTCPESVGVCVCVCVPLCVKVNVSRAMARLNYSWSMFIPSPLLPFSLICHSPSLHHPSIPMWFILPPPPLLVWPCCWVLTDNQPHAMSACLTHTV